MALIEINYLEFKSQSEFVSWKLSSTLFPCTPLGHFPPKVLHQNFHWEKRTLWAMLNHPVYHRPKLKLFMVDASSMVNLWQHKYQSFAVSNVSFSKKTDQFLPLQSLRGWSWMITTTLRAVAKRRPCDSPRATGRDARRSDRWCTRSAWKWTSKRRPGFLGDEGESGWLNMSWWSQACYPFTFDLRDHAIKCMHQNSNQNSSITSIHQEIRQLLNPLVN